MRRKLRLQYHRRRQQRRRASRIFHLSVLMLFIAAISCIFRPSAEKNPLFLVPDRRDQTISVFLHDENRLCQMSAETYLMRVLAAEMSASYHLQALRAQAVASRSYTCFRMRRSGGSGCASHPEADICTDPACCQAYAAEQEPIDTRILRAVFDTRGEVLMHEGKVINALYHACSGGYTENSEAVFSAALPYLRAVESPNEENYPQYGAQYEFSSAELQKIFGIDPNRPLKKQFEAHFSAHGRLESITVSGRTYRGTEFRRLLCLPSTCMTLSFSASGLSIRTSGYGHGVGMSQVGADAMAQRGASYREILKWYYTDCEIGSVL